MDTNTFDEICATIEMFIHKILLGRLLSEVVQGTEKETFAVYFCLREQLENNEPRYSQAITQFREANVLM